MHFNLYLYTQVSTKANVKDVKSKNIKLSSLLKGFIRKTNKIHDTKLNVFINIILMCGRIFKVEIEYDVTKIFRIVT